MAVADRPNIPVDRSERVSEELREADISLRRLAAIVESSEDAIIAKDLKGRIVEWNRSAERMFGYSREEAVGRSIEMLMPPDRADDWKKILEARGRTGSASRTSKRAVGPVTDEFWMRL